MKILDINIMSLFTRLLSMMLLIILTNSCKGRETENIDNKKVNSSQPSIEKHKPFIYTNSKQHSTLNGIVREFVWQIYQDRKGNYWFGTNHDGILVYDNNSIIQYTSKDGIGGNAVRAITEDKIGNIWFGTSNGLTKYNGKEFTNYTIDDGLIDNEVWAIEVDNT